MFKKNGYEYIKNFIDESTVEIISMYFENKIRFGELKPCRPYREQKTNYTTKFGSSFELYSDPLTESLLLKKMPLVSKICGMDLYPTYSYFRIYQEGDRLERHIDRPSCEIALTINIFSKEKKCPFYIEDLNLNVIEFNIEPGDALMYLGNEMYHWRKPIKKDQFVVQFTLHYVNKNGKNKEWKFDKRQNLGFDDDKNQYNGRKY